MFVSSVSMKDRYLAIIMTRVKELISSLYGAYDYRAKIAQDAMQRLSAHSTAGYALVIAVNAAAMLLKATLEVEFCYYFRPYYWKIIHFLAYILSLGLMLIAQGIFFIYSIITLIFYLIWQFLVPACYELMMLTVHLLLTVVYSMFFVLNNALSGLSKVAQVSRLLRNDLVAERWKSLTYTIVVLVVISVIAIVKWLHCHWEKFKPRNSIFAHIDPETQAVICPDSPLGKCAMGPGCKNKHCPLPFCWQFRQQSCNQWTSFTADANVHIERSYCNVDKLEIRLDRSLEPPYSTGVINFQEMTMQTDSVHLMLRRLSTPSYIQEPVKALATKWVWYWEDGDGWKKVSPLLTQESIEAAYLNGEKAYFFHTDKFNYMLMFHEKTMYQKNMDPRYLTERNVRRRPLFVGQSALLSRKSVSSYGDLVSSSDPSGLLDQDSDFGRIPLSPDSKEFQDVKAQFHTTIPPNKAQVSKIEKIKNDYLLERYKRKQEQMKKKQKASDSNKIERHLFHGTSSDVVSAICKQNFDHQVHGKNGTAYGEGSYFAVKASYSNMYSTGERGPGSCSWPVC